MLSTLIPSQPEPQSGHVNVTTLSRRLAQGTSLDPGGVHIIFAIHLKALRSHCHGLSSPATLMLCLKGEAFENKTQFLMYVASYTADVRCQLWQQRPAPSLSIDRISCRDHEQTRFYSKCNNRGHSTHSSTES